MRPVRLQKVQVGFPVVALVGLVDVRGGKDKHGGAGGVPLEGDVCALEETAAGQRLRLVAFLQLREGVDADAARGTLQLGHEHRELGVVARGGHRQALHARAPQTGHDARGKVRGGVEVHLVAHQPRHGGLVAAPLQARPGVLGERLLEELEHYGARLGVENREVLLALRVRRRALENDQERALGRERCSCHSWEGDGAGWLIVARIVHRHTLLVNRGVSVASLSEIHCPYGRASIQHGQVETWSRITLHDCETIGASGVDLQRRRHS
mmetsp:Transcript_19364/g.42371  ORF Transcript_19364/g.42371 Transcript_19364/m.42371 type:complete len:268 (+) Transcript_19364:531-1334(+)